MITPPANRSEKTRSYFLFLLLAVFFLAAFFLVDFFLVAFFLVALRRFLVAFFLVVFFAFFLLFAGISRITSFLLRRWDGYIAMHGDEIRRRKFLIRVCGMNGEGSVKFSDLGYDPEIRSNRRIPPFFQYCNQVFKFFLPASDPISEYGKVGCKLHPGIIWKDSQ